MSSYATHAVPRISVRLHRVSFYMLFVYVLVGDFENFMGRFNCLKFFDIYKYSLPHICIYNRF